MLIASSLVIAAAMISARSSRFEGRDAEHHNYVPRSASAIEMMPSDRPPVPKPIRPRPAE